MKHTNHGQDCKYEYQNTGLASNERRERVIRTQGQLTHLEIDDRQTLGPVGWDKILPSSKNGYTMLHSTNGTLR